MKKLLLFALTAGLIACGVPATETHESPHDDDEAEVEDHELPPDGALPLSGIVAALEAGGNGSILEVEFEDGVWKVESYVDPLTGEVLLPEVGEGARPLSEIIAAVETAGHAPILEVEFEDGVWTVETLQDGEEHDLLVDPRSTAIRAE